MSTSSFTCRDTASGAHERHDVADDVAHIQSNDLELVPLEQRTHPVDNGARTLVVLDDVGKNRANLVEVRRCTLHEQLRRLGIAQDRAERLIDLVRQCGGELAHHRDAADVRDLVL